MYYYKAKDNRSLLAFKQILNVENYPEYSQDMINEYEQITEEEYIYYQEHLTEIGGTEDE